jgi:hypothetical protein
MTKANETVEKELKKLLYRRIYSSWWVSGLREEKRIEKINFKFLRMFKDALKKIFIMETFDID